MSDLVTGQDAPNFRVISGTPQEMQHLMNQLLTDYSAHSLYWCTIDGKVILSALLMHNRIINRARLAATQIGGRAQ